MYNATAGDIHSLAWIPVIENIILVFYIYVKYKGFNIYFYKRKVYFNVYENKFFIGEKKYLIYKEYMLLFFM